MREIRTMVPFPPFNYRIFVIFTDNLTGSADRLAKKGLLEKDHGIDDTTSAFTVRMSNQSYGFVVFKTNATPNEIAHESYHAVSKMFSWIGAVKEEELFAYHLGYLVQMIHNDKEKAIKKFSKGLTKGKSCDRIVI